MPRNPQRTREVLLRVAAQEIHKSGFRGADLETILAKAGLTKGALYHHFANKEELGYAVVEEIIAAIGREKWSRPLRQADDPIDALIGIVQSTPLVRDSVARGCPVINLVQEMSPLDEGFRKRLAELFTQTIAQISTALREGQRRGMVRGDRDPQETASFVFAAYEGYLSLAKGAQDPRFLQSGIESIVRYLEGLRPNRP